MIYVIDIDGTICDKDICGEDGNYELSIPKKDRITKINELYDAGHVIKYLTVTWNG